MAEKTPRPRSKLLLILLVSFTVLVAGLIASLFAFDERLADNIDWYENAIPNLVFYIGTFVLLMCWLTYLAFFSRLGFIFSKLIPGLVILNIIVLLVLFQPIPGGSMEIVGFKPRFWKRELPELANSGAVDLGKISTVDFPEFFGRGRTGTVDWLSIDEDWSANPPVLKWKIEVGESWSGFAAVNGFAVTMEQRGENETVTCYEIATGESRWNYAYPARHDDPLGGVGPHTPTIHQGRVYSQGAKGDVTCINGSDGSLEWTTSLTDLFDVRMTSSGSSGGLKYQTEQNFLMWGRAGSPLIYGDLVILPAKPRTVRVGNQQEMLKSTDGISLVAFDKMTGEKKWESGKDGIAYGSPSIARIHGEDQVLIVNESSASGHDPLTGKLLWAIFREGDSSANANTSQVTYLGENRILLSKGYGLGGELVEITRNPDGSFATNQLWQRRPVLKTKMTSPVIHDGYAYALSDGLLECTRLSDGQRMWKVRKSDGGHRFLHGQLLLVGEHLLIHSQGGQLILADASPDDYVEHGSIETVRGVCWNTIAVYDRYVLVRSQLEAACFEMPVAATSNQGSSQ